MYGSYNPYSFNYNNPYTQRLAELQQQQAYQQYPSAAPQGPQNAPMLKGRVVASIEEARAAQVDLDGSLTYFASPGESKIYVKSIGLNGLPVFQVYCLDNSAAVQAAPQNNNNNTNDVASRLSALEEKVKELSEYAKPNAANE